MDALGVDVVTLQSKVHKANSWHVFIMKYLTIFNIRILNNSKQVKDTNIFRDRNAFKFINVYRLAMCYELPN